MFHDSNTHMLRLLADERQESLRRTAGASRLRREARQMRSSERRRRRAGPNR